MLHRTGKPPVCVGVLARATINTCTMQCVIYDFVSPNYVNAVQSTPRERDRAEEKYNIKMSNPIFSSRIWASSAPQPQSMCAHLYGFERFVSFSVCMLGT